MLNLGSGMGMNHWEWEEMGLKKSFLLTSTFDHVTKMAVTPLDPQY